MLHQNPPLGNFRWLNGTSQVISIIEKNTTFIISISVVFSNLIEVFHNINNKALQGVFPWLQQSPNLTSILWLLHNDAFTTVHWSGHLPQLHLKQKPNLHTKVSLKISSRSDIFGSLTHLNQSKVKASLMQVSEDTMLLHISTLVLDHLEKF